ncbi:MAG TPA: PQQ-binding-like beta-propeller repeat protein [Acidimicrobiales bacterium]|nr:PQQ-binding-like beta-propeller repeat protein [Acidimicrobiales bacterium]
MAATTTLALSGLAPVGPAAAVGGSWPVYHGDFGGSGVAPGSTTFGGASGAWVTRGLKGKLYGAPVVAQGVVIVATEYDMVYALSETTGAVLWTRHLGTAVPAHLIALGAGCPGDIRPTVGITGTPVIDTARSEVFVVADEHVGSAVTHHVVGLSLSTGLTLLDQVIDPPGTVPQSQLFRAALTLDGGNVIASTGGNAGDCGPYHGWVISVPETGGALRTFEVDPTPGNQEGAVWMGGAAPVIDGHGNIWVATGNGSNDTGSNPDYSDSVVELSSTLAVLQWFAPTSWATDNDSDLDLGSSVPAVLPDGFVLQAGKSQTAYLLDQSNLGNVGGQVAELDNICGSDVDGGIAYRNSVIYLPCLAGVMALQVQTSPPSLTQLWQTGNSQGPPIVADGLVWSINHGSHRLYGLDPSTGNTVVQFKIASVANHFPTPSAVDGMLFATSATRVYAYYLH